MKAKPKFQLKEKTESKREEKREAKMNPFARKKLEAQEGKHFKKGGPTGKRGC